MTRKLGPFSVADIGLGCMNLSHAYGTPPDASTGRRVLLAALEGGVTHFDTAALYGFGANETLLGDVLRPHRDRIVLASKCGMHGIEGKRTIDNRPESLRWSCEESLRRLQTDHIDLFYLHRYDPVVPIEESVEALAGLIAAGKVCAIGLSEVSVATLGRAHAVHPIAAVQTEYSLWTRNPELGVLDYCAEIGAAFVAFSPLGRGFLADAVHDPAAFVSGDIRRAMPRFQGENFQHNLSALDQFRVLAAELGAAPAQLALAWLLHRAPHIVPIPGTTSVEHLNQNIAASALHLGDGDLARIDAVINRATIQGSRYPAVVQREIDTEEF